MSTPATPPMLRTLLMAASALAGLAWAVATWTDQPPPVIHERHALPEVTGLLENIRAADVLMAEIVLSNIPIHTPMGTSRPRSSVGASAIMTMDGRNAIVEFHGHHAMWLQIKDGGIVAGGSPYKKHEARYLDAFKAVHGVLAGHPMFTCATTEMTQRPSAKTSHGVCSFALTDDRNHFLIESEPRNTGKVLKGHFTLCASDGSADSIECQPSAPAVKMTGIWLDPWLGDGFWDVRGPGPGHAQFSIWDILLEEGRKMRRGEIPLRDDR